MANLNKTKTYLKTVYVKVIVALFRVQVDGGEEDEQRDRELNLLRRLCIPPLCFLLHTILHASEDFAKVSEIAEIVASEQHQLYKV